MNKNKLLYLSGILASQLGSNLFIIAMIIWLKETQGKTSILGLFLFCSATANLIASPFSGVWVDRLGAKKIMIFTDLANGIIMIIISLLMMKVIPTSFLVETILVLTFISSTMTTLFTPASLSLIGQIATIDEAKNITSWSSNISEVSKIIGKSMAGIIVIIISPSLLILINGLSFLISSLLESQIVVFCDKSKDKGNSVGYFSQLKEGAVYLLGNKLLISLFIGAAGTNFFMAINGPLMPTLINDILGRDLWWYGVIMSASGVGAIIGGVLARKLSKKTCAKTFSFALILQGLPFALVPLVGHPIFIFLLIMLVGFFYVFVQVNMLTIVIKVVPVEMRGRIFSLMFAIVGLFMPISYLISGGLADQLNEKIAIFYYISGLGIPIVWIFALIKLKDSHSTVLRSA